MVSFSDELPSNWFRIKYMFTFCVNASTIKGFHCACAIHLPQLLTFRFILASSSSSSRVSCQLCFAFDFKHQLLISFVLWFWLCCGFAFLFFSAASIFICCSYWLAVSRLRSFGRATSRRHNKFNTLNIGHQTNR